MNLTQQKQLVMRMQADLRKVAAADCHVQADALEFVVDSLTILRRIRETATALAEVEL